MPIYNSAPKSWPSFAEMTLELKEALKTTEIPDIVGDVQQVRAGLTFSRTDPEPGIGEKEIKAWNSDKSAELRALVYFPENATEDLPVYVLFHPGGFFLGQPEFLESYCRGIVSDHNIVVFAPSYRLAPENPFPAGVNDVCDWSVWIAHHAHELGIHANPQKGYILGGQSVGGNMAMVAALRLRDDPTLLGKVKLTGLHTLTSQLCTYGATPTEYKEYYTSYDQSAEAPVFNRKVQNKMKELLRPDHQSWSYNPLIHPKGLAGLPPTYMMTAGNDPCRDDNLITERILRERYGVKTRLDIYQGAPHLFWINFGELEVTKQWRDDHFEGLNWLLSGGE